MIYQTEFLVERIAPLYIVSEGRPETQILVCAASVYSNHQDPV